MSSDFQASVQGRDARPSFQGPTALHTAQLPLPAVGREPGSHRWGLDWASSANRPLSCAVLYFRWDDYGSSQGLHTFMGWDQGTSFRSTQLSPRTGSWHKGQRCPHRRPTLKEQSPGHPADAAL